MSAGVAVLRSLDLAQGSPFLERAWKKIRLDCDTAELWVSDQSTRSSLPEGARYLSQWSSVGVDDMGKGVVLSWSVPNERTLEEAAFFSGRGMVPGSLSALYAFADKRATKALFRRFGLPTPEGVVLDRGFTEGGLIRSEFVGLLEHALVAHLSYPLIVKPLWDCMGHGTSIIDELGHLEDAFRAAGGRDLLVEEFVDGTAGSIEVLGVPGDYQFQPPCSTGRSADGISSGFDSIRVSHSGLFATQISPTVLDALAQMLGTLGFRGACCIDFVVGEAGIQFLEVNPRVSGASCLSAAASGVDAFESTYRVARGQWNQWPGRRVRDHASLQAGGIWATRMREAIARSGVSLDWHRDGEITVDGIVSESVIVGGHASAIRTVLRSLGVECPFWDELPAAAVA